MPRALRDALLFTAAAAVILTLLGVYALIPLTWAAARLTHHPPASLGLNLSLNRAVQFASGILLGSAMVAALFLSFRVFSAFHLEPHPAASTAAAVTGLTFYLKGSIFEELLFRGYAFLRLREWLGIPATQAIAAVAFALYHVANTGMPVLPAFLFPGVAGLLFGYAFLRSRGVILPIAMHAAWNYWQEQIGISSGRNQPGLWTVVRDSDARVSSVLAYALTLVVLALAALTIRHFTKPKETEPAS